MTLRLHTSSFLIFLFVVCNVATLLSAQVPPVGVATRSYKISSLGNVEMTVPIHWQENVRLLDKPPAFTLAYRLTSTKDFYMKVTSAWEPQQERASRDPGWLRRAVEKVGRTKDKDVRLLEVNGPIAKGYYFQVQHKEKFPIGEFEFLLAGSVDLGTITVVFSAYSNEKDPPEFAQALRVLETARFLPAN